MDPAEFENDDKEAVEFCNEKMKHFDANMIKYFNQAINLYKANVAAKFELDEAAQGARDPWVLFLIDDSERNVIDQKVIESQLFATYGIKSMRHTFKEVFELMDFDQDTHILKIRNKEIGFVYYRNGYQVEQYQDENDWETRRILEIS